MYFGVHDVPKRINAHLYVHDGGLIGKTRCSLVVVLVSIRRLLCTYADASWQFATAVEKRDHPGTSLILSVRMFSYVPKPLNNQDR